MIASKNGKPWLPSKEALFLVGAMIIAGGSFYAVLATQGVSGGRWAKEDALCDQAVSTLLTTKDLVELQRSIFLIRWYNCSIGRRL